jgi:protease-4
MKKLKEALIKIKDKIKAFLKRLIQPIKWVFIIAIGIIIGGSALSLIPDETETILTEDYSDENCNVSGITIHGDIYTYVPTDKDLNNIEGYEDSTSSESVNYYIQQAENDPKIKAILVEVDSYGGYPVAGEEIATDIKLASKPVITFIRSAGTSAAYWAISTADRVFASNNSDVGSIGITMSYLQNVKKNKKDGLEYIQLSSGKFKDSGSPDKAITDEEKSIFQRDLKILYENFIKAVSLNRNIPIEKVRAIADGSSVLGEKAKELGLIDEIGGYNEARKYIEEKIGEKVEVCW